MLEKREWVRAKQDHLRRSLMLEPRGHADMYGAVFTEAVVAGSHAGVLFMHNEGYSTMCGHGIIAVMTIIIERSLLATPRLPDAVLDSPAGPIRARAHLEAGVDPPRVERVSLVNVPAFVLAARLTVTAGARSVPADIAFGGAFYAVVDSEAAGVPIAVERLDDLRRLGMEIKRQLEAMRVVEHPTEPGLAGIYGTIFTGPPSRADAD